MFSGRNIAPVYTNIYTYISKVNSPDKIFLGRTEAAGPTASFPYIAGFSAAIFPGRLLPGPRLPFAFQYLAARNLAGLANIAVPPLSQNGPPAVGPTALHLNTGRKIPRLRKCYTQIFFGARLPWFVSLFVEWSTPRTAGGGRARESGIVSESRARTCGGRSAACKGNGMGAFRCGLRGLDKSPPTPQTTNCWLECCSAFISLRH